MVFFSVFYYVLMYKIFRAEVFSVRNDVDICSEIKDLWERQVVIYVVSCGGVSEYYCLRDKDGKKREFCLEKIRILQGRNIKRVGYYYLVYVYE